MCQSLVASTAYTAGSVAMTVATAAVEVRSASIHLHLSLMIVRFYLRISYTIALHVTLFIKATCKHISHISKRSQWRGKLCHVHKQSFRKVVYSLRRKNKSGSRTSIGWWKSVENVITHVRSSWHVFNVFVHPDLWLWLTNLRLPA